ncbi:MAG: hypothetical protein ACXWZM_09695 [Solirubrobacterales bacterium]
MGYRPLTEERPMTRFVIAAIETDHLSRNATGARAGRRTWVVWERDASAPGPRPTPVTAPGRPV